jgi:hypothetical protein
MIIDSIQQLEDIKSDSVFLYPITRDERTHKHSNAIIGFVLIDIATKQPYTISNGHPEGIFNTNKLDFLKKYKVYCYDTSVFKYQGYDTSTFIDVKMQYYLYTNQGYEAESTNITSHYTRQFNNCFKVNELISLYKHEEIALQIFEESWVRDDQVGLSFYQNDLLNAFHNIEKHGLKIDVSLFDERFGYTPSKHNDKCYTEYNYYTTTGRPSNRFGGINFAALKKEDETRECFISEFGTLVEIDFNSYHPRLIASIIGYDFGKDNVYEHLAKHYHNTDKPTVEQISQAKEDTFRQLYGGIRKEYLHIPFFAKTNDLAQMFWEEANDKGYIESPISGRRLVLANYQDITCYTLFNYFIQMYETEHNVLLLNNLFHKLDEEIVPILYTYDSILFDLPQNKCNRLQELLLEVIPLQFPFKVKTGINYKDLH